MKDYGEARREFWGQAAAAALIGLGGEKERAAKIAAEYADAILEEWERRWTVQS